MLIEGIDAARWATMSNAAKRELVSCYEEDLQEAAQSAGTTIEEARSAFVTWLDHEMGRGHTTYYVGKTNGEPVTLLRVHDDLVPGELLIEALQTVVPAQGKGLARHLLASVLRRTPGAYCADVHVTNVASQATFARAGFTRTPGPASNHDRWRRNTTQHLASQPS